MSTEATTQSPPAVKPGRLWIDGQYVDAEGGAVFTIVNPALGEPLTTCASATPADIDAIGLRRDIIEQRRIGQVIVQNHVSLLKAFFSTKGQQFRVAGARSHEIDLACLLHHESRPSVNFLENDISALFEQPFGKPDA